MSLVNTTRHKILASDFTLCTTPFSQARGLMFSKRKTHKTLIFVFDHDHKVSLHNFFVFYPIDVVFLNAEKKIVEIKENFEPFTLYFPQQTARYVVELPSGTVKTTKSSVGDYITF